MAAQQSSGRFSRFGEKRKLGSDTTGYDEYVEGVEADETTSLQTPLKEDNLGFKLIQKMGWQSGAGLGRFEQGRVDPVPFEMKDDHMGLGRWTMELELAQDATEKRRLLEAEKEMTEDLIQQYHEQAEKEKKMTEILTEMNKSFYCELCDRQYTKYSEFDNHINSYSHHHNQRLRDLKQYETGRKFGGHRSTAEEKQKMVAAHKVALERAQMRARQQKKARKGGFSPGFKPIGSDSSTASMMVDAGSDQGGNITKANTTDNTSSQEKDKVAAKKQKLAKFGLKFMSAGTLISISDQIGKDTPLQQLPTGNDASSSAEVDAPLSRREADRKALIEKQKVAYTTMWDKEGAASRVVSKALPVSSDKPPPPLMSRQRELIMEKASEADSDDEDSSLTAKTLIKKAPGFKFKIGKK